MKLVCSLPIGTEIILMFSTFLVSGVELEQNVG